MEGHPRAERNLMIRSGEGCGGRRREERKVIPTPRLGPGSNRQEPEHVAALLTAGGHDREHPLDESAAPRAAVPPLIFRTTRRDAMPVRPCCSSLDPRAREERSTGDPSPSSNIRHVDGKGHNGYRSCQR